MKYIAEISPFSKKCLTVIDIGTESVMYRATIVILIHLGLTIQR
jgi:hypothetical protein